MCRANRKELMEVVKYFRDELDHVWNTHLALNQYIATELMSAGVDIVRTVNLAKEQLHR